MKGGKPPERRVGEMNEFPADVLAAAEDLIPAMGPGKSMRGSMVFYAARAIMNERERCARIAQNQVREADSEWAEGFSVAAAGIASAIRAQTR